MAHLHRGATAWTKACMTPLMPSTPIGSDTYQCLSHCFNSTRVRTHEVQMPWPSKTGDGRSTHSANQSGCWWLWVCWSIVVASQVVASQGRIGALKSLGLFGQGRRCQELNHSMDSFSNDIFIPGNKAVHAIHVSCHSQKQTRALSLFSPVSNNLKL